MLPIRELRARFEADVPVLWRETQELTARQLEPLASRLRAGDRPRSFPRTFNDPVWGAVQLLPHETALLDTPLLQRLRGVRQLGMAHLVYPAATHSRLEHCIGAVQVAQRMLDALGLNAKYRREYGTDPDPTIPEVSPLDAASTRVAALLHDIGHGPYSHATEGLIAHRHEPEVKRVKSILKQTFDGTTDVSTGEALAALIVLSPVMQEVLEKLAPVAGSADLSPAIASRILGSRDWLHAKYLSGVISGPLDADKLDYMARDSYHSGFPVGLDTGRLISKLEVVRVTPENAFNDNLRERARAAPGGYYYEMGLSLAGLGAYEQMLIGRVLLYDRLYYHHKVRAAEEMTRALIRVAEEEAGALVSLPQMFAAYPDDAVPEILGGQLTAPGLLSGKVRARALALAIRERRIYNRAFAFGVRFIQLPEGLSDEDAEQTRKPIWNEILGIVTTPDEAVALVADIHRKALELSEQVPGLKGSANDLLAEQVLVNFPINKSVARGNDILTRTESGAIASPTLFFDPERWSKAYEQQKHAGFVFCPAQYRAVVNLASKIVFYERFSAAMSPKADTAAKVTGVVRQAWIDEAVGAGLCSRECADVLSEKAPAPLVKFRPGDIKLPGDVTQDDPDLPKRIADDFNEALPGGLPGTVHRAVLGALEQLGKFLLAMHRMNPFTDRDISEADLQAKAREFFEHNGIKVQEAEKIAGGETDLVLPGSIVLENKKRGAMRDPVGTGANFAWQARRYAHGLCRRVGFVLVAYKPVDEKARLSPAQSIRVEPLDAPEGFAHVRIAVPYGESLPHDAKAPS